MRWNGDNDGGVAVVVVSFEDAVDDDADDDDDDDDDDEVNVDGVADGGQKDRIVRRSNAACRVCRVRHLV